MREGSTGASGTVPVRPVDARLARLHLRSGLHPLGRAELEALAGTAALGGGAALDAETLLDLAEARWRTGDLAGAGEAAAAYLHGGGEAALGYVIAAEAMSGLGRPGEAKRLAGHALERIDVPLDLLFAGMGRSGVWPMDPADPGEPVAALFPPAGQSTVRPPTRSRPARAVVSGPQSAGSAVGRVQAPGGARGHDDVGDHASDGSHARAGSSNAGHRDDHSTSPGLWDADDAGFGSRAPLDAVAELAAARTAIAEGRADEAAVRLAVALRIAPSLAPAVLDAAGATSGPSFDLVRGDAYRLVGHEIEARRAYAAAAGAVHGRAPHDAGGSDENSAAPSGEDVPEHDDPA